MAIPYTYDNEKVEKILRMIAAGAPAKTACAACGVPNRTFTDWKAKGRKGLEPYATFLDRVEEARAIHLDIMSGAVYHAARAGDWKAAAWVLERRDPENYGKKEKVEHSGTTTQVQVKGGALGRHVTDKIRAQVLGLSRADLQEREDESKLSDKKWGLE